MIQKSQPFCEEKKRPALAIRRGRGRPKPEKKRRDLREKRTVSIDKESAGESNFTPKERGTPYRAGKNENSSLGRTREGKGSG